MSWFRRGWLLRGQVTCYALFFALIVGGAALVYVGYTIPDWVVAVCGSTLLGFWCVLYWLLLWLEKRDRGHAGTLVFDGTTIALMRGSKLRWRRNVNAFECGWWFDSSQTAVELQLPNGNLVVACPEQADVAKHWLAATGLDAPSRKLTMRLDDGFAEWLWQSLLFAISMLSLASIVLWLMPAKRFPPLAIDAATAVLLVGSGVMHARAHALARVVLDANGVRIRRWGSPTRHLSWISVRGLEQTRETLGDDFLEIELTNGKKIRLRSKLELFRLKILVDRIKRGIASFEHDGRPADQMPAVN